MNNLFKKLIPAILIMFIIVAASIGTASAYTYNRNAAVDFAKANYQNYNLPGSSYFKNNGGDCTNFISQCLKAGGWRQISTSTNPAKNWYYNSLNSRSSSWAGVQPFREFATASGRGKEVLFAKGTCTLPSSVPIRDGDIIQIDFTGDGKWDHSTIVTNLACSIYSPYNSIIWVTAHSNSQINYPLSEYLKASPNSRFRVILLKDTYY